MSDLVLDIRRIALGTDVIILRPEATTDATFLQTLFTAITLRTLGMNAGPAADLLIDMQYRSRAQHYAAAWPAARRWVIEHDEVPVGALIEGDAGDAIHVIDIAFLPQLQGQGLGTAVLADLQSRAGACGKGITAQVMVSNVASLALFRRRGFVGAAQHGDAQIGVRWTP